MGLVVSEFEQVNAFFQAASADPELMVKELDQHLTSLKARVYDSTGTPRCLTNVLTLMLTLAASLSWR